MIFEVDRNEVDALPSDSQDEQTIVTLIGGTREILFRGPLNILLICIPFAIASKYRRFGDGPTFLLSLLALAPMAERLGFIKEQLCMHTNETTGGLLFATFGNGTALIVAVAALKKGLYRLVQLSLLGSIFSNMLLVLGSAFLIGGFHKKQQYFGKNSSQMNSTLLVLATGAILFPTILRMSGEETRLGMLALSRCSSLVMLMTYLVFLYFQLYTHKDVHEEKNKAYRRVKHSKVHAYTEVSTVDLECDDGNESDPQQRNSPVSANPSYDDDCDGKEVNHLEDDDENEIEKEVLGFWPSLFWLATVTVLTSVLSELVSGSIEDGAKAIGISPVFFASIILPIVGNAAEHAGAVVLAMKGKLDLSLDMAIGSSTQMALFVLPILVMMGWLSDRELSLDFGPFESISLLLTVLIVTFAIKDGRSNWLVGFILVVMYTIISLGFSADNNHQL